MLSQEGSIGESLSNMFQDPPDINITQTRTRRRNRCSHCGQVGHNIQTCPDEALQERRRQQRALRLQNLQLSNQSNTRLISFRIYNDNMYPILVYWYHRSNPDKLCTYLFEIPPFSQSLVNASRIHNIVSIPSEELPKHIPSLNTTFADKIKLNDYPQLFITGDTNLEQLNPTTSEIIFFKEYAVQKTELEKWKECGLKSIFLLKEIERLGGKRVDTIEPIIDMVQDIIVPPHDEIDKERAGVPSTFTNIS